MQFDVQVTPNAREDLRSLRAGDVMTVYDLRVQPMTLDELFRRAASEPIRVITKEGTTLVIEAADEFDREVAMLQASPACMAFLAERARATDGSIALDELDRQIDAELAAEAARQNQEP